MTHEPTSGGEAVLREIASRKLHAEITDCDPDELDWLGGYEECVRKARAALATPAASPATAGRDEASLPAPLFYMIEMSRERVGSGPPHWWSPTGWHSDWTKAARFGSREDAERIRHDCTASDNFVSEHAIVSTASKVGVDQRGMDTLINECWQELCERDDRTSPPERPDMCLITAEELGQFMESARILESLTPNDAVAKPGRRDSKEPCGECHIGPEETCDICGARHLPTSPTPAVRSTEGWRGLDDARLQRAIDAFYEPCEGTTIDGVRNAILAWERG